MIRERDPIIRASWRDQHLHRPTPADTHHVARVLIATGLDHGTNAARDIAEALGLIPVGQP